VIRRFSFAIALAALLSAAAGADTRPVTLLFTNDFESAFEPVEAYWRDDIEYIGGIAHLATLVEQYRENEETTFLFDAGDIYTGTLSKLTKGELPFELMITMGYDAMAIGNHEFEYGWLEFAAQKNRAPFPVLGANLFYKGTDHPYAQPYAIVERNGIRIAVIGILGRDAATALIPSHIAGVDVRDPAPIVTNLVRALRPDVDLVVLLTHQGKTAPMQTDDEGHPEIRRDIEADIALAGVVDGIDVLLGGHADAGTREPVVQPDTGTIIMQTFGQGQHLGVLKLDVDTDGGGVRHFDGRLVTVDSNALPPHRLVQEKIDRYRARFPEYFEPIATTEAVITRRYDEESDLGNLFADILREKTGAPIALVPSGALRKDLPAGEIKLIDLLDAFPFTDRIAIMELDSGTLLDVIEQGLSRERGMLQVSGLEVQYDPSLPVGRRVRGIEVDGKGLRLDGRYRVATLEILAQGGDLYTMFGNGRLESMSDERFADVLEAWFRARDLVRAPPRGRLVPASR